MLIAVRMLNYILISTIDDYISSCLILIIALYLSIYLNKHLEGKQLENVYNNKNKSKIYGIICIKH